MNILMWNPISLLLAAAAENGAAGFEGIPGAPAWLNSLLIIVIPILVYFGGRYLHNKRLHVQAQLANENLTKKERLELRLKDFAYMRAESFVQKDFLNIANELIKGKQKKEGEESLAARAKEQLKLLGERLQNEAESYFSEDDIDIVAELGEDRIKQIIEDAANRVSPFPGKNTVESLLGGGAEALLKKGSVWLKARVEATGEIPPAN